MYRKILVAGATAAAIIGAGGVALATTGDNTTAGQPSSTSTSSSQHGSHTGDKTGRAGRLFRHLVQGQITVKDKKGLVTYELIRGSVTSVSPTAITVESVNHKSETYTIGKDTKVVSKTKGQKASASTITKVAKGDQVLVAGTGSSPYAAKYVVDVHK